tara:strand:+ start:31917 stop:32642 length:726 start_codon:yes stop_codon:yes gene_type:complete
MNVIILSKISPIEGLLKELKMKHIRSIYAPLINASAITISSQKIKKIGSANKIIFQSKNAVKYSKKLYEMLKKNKSISYMSVGKFSALEIKKVYNVKCEYPINNFSSDSLLQMPNLENVNGQKIVVVRGKDGRRAIEKTIKNRGAEVIIIESYKREILEENLTKIRLDKDCTNYVITLSKVALDEFCTKFDHEIPKYKIIVIVPSKRVANEINKSYSMKILKMENIESEKSYIECILNESK